MAHTRTPREIEGLTSVSLYLHRSLGMSYRRVLRNFLRQGPMVEDLGEREGARGWEIERNVRVPEIERARASCPRRSASPSCFPGFGLEVPLPGEKGTTWVQGAEFMGNFL